jgi:hypothetical protein
MYNFILTSLTILIFSAPVAVGTINERPDLDFYRKKPQTNGKTVKWIGETSCMPSSHNTRHNHQLIFKGQLTGIKYNLQSDRISKIHCESSKNLLVEIQANKPETFLFGKPTIKEKSFRMLNFLGEEGYDHVTPVPRGISAMRDRR